MEVLDLLLSQQDQSQPTRAKVKTLSIPMDPHFLALIFKEIPGVVRQDKISVFDNLVSSFISSNIPNEFASNRKLEEIHRRAVDNATVYRSLKDEKTMSVMEYIRRTDGPYPEIQFQESELKKLQKVILFVYSMRE